MDNKSVPEGVIVQHNPTHVHAHQVPKDLLPVAPRWAEALLERGATFGEFAAGMGQAARDSTTPAQLREVLRVAEQLTLSDEGRQAVESVLTRGFLSRLTALVPYAHVEAFRPAMIVYEAPNTAWPAAWLSPWEDETIWPVASLQLAQLDQAISSVWQDNYRPFVELFLFNGTNLQGQFARIARVQSPVTQLELQLDDLTVNNQSRSLLATARSIPGRRFSAKQELDQVVTATITQWASTATWFGQASMTQPPTISWDGYDLWFYYMGEFPVPPKSAALRIEFPYQVNDTLYGATSGQFRMEVLLDRTGGANPISWSISQTHPGLPQPWVGTGLGPTSRWGWVVTGLTAMLVEALEQQIGQLAGTAPGSMRILPGNATAMPNPPATHWGLIEIGNTTDNATIAFYP